MSVTLTLLSLVYVLLPIADGDITQDNLDYMAENLGVNFEVITNLNDYISEVTFTNRGDQPVPGEGWRIHFPAIRLLYPLDHPYADGHPLGDTQISLFHVTGSNYYLKPDDDFPGIAPSESVTVQFIANAWTASRTDLMPNWYVTANGLEPVVIADTGGEDLDWVEEFSTSDQWKRGEDDLFDPYTVEDRYSMFTDTAGATSSSSVHIIPSVFHHTFQDQSESLNVDDNWTVQYPSTLGNEGIYLMGKLNLQRDTSTSATNVIILEVDESPTPEGIPATYHDVYNIVVSSDDSTIKITGESSSSVFHGIQTLLQLLTDNEGSYTVPVGEVRDGARFAFRGMHLDVSRNFREKEDILQLLEVMAMYKLNKFHFHLTDDEGWRLEIPGLPELTQVGAARCHDETENECLMPQLGSRPTIRDSGSGYYSVSDYREILQKAEELHIEVIPEFDMPGHAHAAIKAMEARKRRLEADGEDEEEAVKYLLTDPEDKSVYLSVQNYPDNAINPCVDTTYNFVKHVVKEVKAMHEGVQVLRGFHFGGDEVAPTAWLNSTACLELLEDHWQQPGDSAFLKAYFATNVSLIVNDLGLNLYGWEDGFMDHQEEQSHPFFRQTFPNEEVYSNVWNNVWEWGGGHRAYLFANKDYKVILSHASHLYFDHPYEPDPEERGYYWATRRTDTRKTFMYQPDDIYANLDVTLMGAEQDLNEICEEFECPELEKPENIIGIQGHLWSETVRKPEQFQTMIYPRLLALAERAWHKAGWEDETDAELQREQQALDWARFSRSLAEVHLPALTEAGIIYNIRPPGAILSEDLILETSTEFPGQTVVGRRESSDEWDELNGTQLEPGTTYYLSTRTSENNRMSRTVKLVTSTPDGNAATSLLSSHFFYLSTLLSLSQVFRL